MRQAIADPIVPRNPLGATRPLVSVVIPTFNRSAFLRESVQGVLDQTFGDLEIIICDDASTDDTAAVCRALESRDARIRTIRHAANLGMVGNANAGLDVCRGDYFCRLDDDNRWLPTFLERSIPALASCPDAAFSFSDEWFIDVNGRRNVPATNRWSRWYGRAAMPEGPVADSVLAVVKQATGINATVFRTDAVRAVGGFTGGLSAGLDFDLFLKLAAANYRATYIAERLVEYRYHAEQSTATRVFSIPKALDAVKMLEDRTFTGPAESLRLRKLARARMALSRTYVLVQDAANARAALAEARRLGKYDLRAYVVSSLLVLPDNWLFELTKRYYRSRLPAGYGARAARKGEEFGSELPERQMVPQSAGLRRL